MTPEYQARLRRLSKWYLPARFGMFYHWGMYSGGGSTEGGKFHTPLKHPTIEAFEAAAGDPAAVATNMLDLASGVGARYVICTVSHGGDAFAVMYPTKLSGFLYKTRLDYTGELLRQGKRRGIPVMLYVPGGCGPWNTPGGPFIAQEHTSPAAFEKLGLDLVTEMVERYGDALAGIWIDGNWGNAFPAHLHKLLPDAICTINNQTNHQAADVDMGTTEFLSHTPDPIYSRPSGLRRPHPQFQLLPPKADFNEDIPTCNGWWHGSPYEDDAALSRHPYVQDPTYWVKEMVSSLGQRRRWNYALGLGPTVEGKCPPVFAPMVANMGRFMAWAGEAIYNTVGGEGSWFEPGWVNAGGFVSVTVSLRDPRIHYVLVTTAPAGPNLSLQHLGGKALRVTDLRSGKEIYGHNGGFLEFAINNDWADVKEFGCKVLKIEMAEPSPTPV